MMTELELTRDQVRSRRHREVRSETLQLDRIPKRERRKLALLHPDLDHYRPSTRGECLASVRPCPYVGCRYHLFLDVSATGNLKMNFPDLEPDQLNETCALDVADAGGEPLEIVGELMNVTRERIRQIETLAKERLERRRGLADAIGQAEPKGDVL